MLKTTNIRLVFRSVSRVLTFLLVTSAIGFSQSRQLPRPAPIARNIMLQIVRAEDERHWDSELSRLLSHSNVAVRKRAALAAGRIGNEQSIGDLSGLLRQDRDQHARAMAAFALGEIESPLAAGALLEARHGGHSVRARALEALGKIAAAMPKEQEARQQELAQAILSDLKAEHGRHAASNRLTILLGLTSVLRSKPANAGPVVAEFLTHSDPRIRADAANTLARLRLKEGNLRLRKLLLSDRDPNVRANAARVLGATEEKGAYDGLLERALKDSDVRVRVSAIRALGGLKDGRATAPLIERGNNLLSSARGRNTYPAEANELLEIATTLGRQRQHSNDERTVNWLKEIRPVTGSGAPELEIALARIHPASYLAQLGPGPIAKQ